MAPGSKALATGTDRKGGPYPVDYQTTDIEFFADWPGVAENLAGIGVVLKEWVGLVAYYAMDRSDELVPGPNKSDHGT